LKAEQFGEHVVQWAARDCTLLRADTLEHSEKRPAVGQALETR
jgi:hypothetical protein